MSIDYITISDIDALVSDFISEYYSGINTIHRQYFDIHDELAVGAFIKEIEEELKNGCISFVNNNSSLDGLNSYLFYITNINAKNKSTVKYRKVAEYLCPGCLFVGRTNLLSVKGNLLVCDDCVASLKKSTDPKMIDFFKVFSKHNKRGYRCPDCNRFIPQPIITSQVIICPYLDCCFSGDLDSLKKMNHPSSQSNLEKLYSDLDVIKAISGSPAADSAFEEKSDLIDKVSVVKSTIDSLKNSVPYNSTDFTAIHKLQAYQAFLNILDLYPEDMIDYLLYNSRSGGFQNKIFQEYIRLIEESMPFCYKKGKEVCRVSSLLDKNLSLFDGISTFNGFVNEKCEVKNNTQEFYIGGRKASYVKPFYIGKLLNIIDAKSKNSLLSNVVEYSFSKIKMKDVVLGSEVIVTHLRVPPHYQMGGMVYVNRARKKIVDKSKLVLKSNEN